MGGRRRGRTHLLPRARGVQAPLALAPQLGQLLARVLEVHALLRERLLRVAVVQVEPEQGQSEVLCGVPVE